MVAPPVPVSSSTSVSKKEAPTSHPLVVSPERNAHLIPYDTDTEGKSFPRKTFKEGGMPIEKLQIQVINQTSLESGAAACGPLSLYNALMLTNYCHTGNAAYLAALTDMDQAEEFLGKAGDVAWTDQESLEKLMTLDKVQRQITPKPSDLRERFGFINTVVIPRSRASEKDELSKEDTDQLDHSDFLVLSDEVKRAIKAFRADDIFIYALIVANIKPRTLGHYWCVVINKCSPEQTQFILADSVNSDHFAIPERKAILDGLIELFIQFPEHML